MRPQATRWTRQPPQPVRIDWNNPLTRGLFVCVSGISNFELVSGRRMTPNGGITQRPGLAGIAHNSDGSNDYLGLDIAPRTLNEVTLFTLAQATSAGTDQRVFSLASSSGTTPYIPIATGNSTAAKLRTVWVNSGGAAVSDGQTTADAFSTTRPIAQALTISFDVGGTDWRSRAYVNGIADAVGTASAVGPGTINRIGIGALYRSSGAVAFWPGSVFIALAWDRALSDAEHSALADNPWQIFQPLPRGWMVGVAGGATQALTGVSAGTAAGTATPSITVALAGAAASVAAGSVSAGSDVTTGLTGVSSAAAAGTLSATTATSAALTGVSSTPVAGTLAASISAALTGVSSTAAAGSLSAGGDASAAVTGQAAATAQGTVGVTVSGAAALSGASAAASAGTVAPAISTALSGASAAAAAGSLTAANSDVSVTITGQAVSVAQGTVSASASGAATVALTGAAAVVMAGNIIVIAPSVGWTPVDDSISNLWIPVDDSNAASWA